jgi:hypothetical protein
MCTAPIFLFLIVYFSVSTLPVTMMLLAMPLTTMAVTSLPLTTVPAMIWHRIMMWMVMWIWNSVNVNGMMMHMRIMRMMRMMRMMWIVMWMIRIMMMALGVTHSNLLQILIQHHM